MSSGQSIPVLGVPGGPPCGSPLPVLCIPPSVIGALVLAILCIPCGIAGTMVVAVLGIVFTPAFTAPRTQPVRHARVPAIRRGRLPRAARPTLFGAPARHVMQA